MLYLVVGYGEHALQGEHHLEGADGEVAEQAPAILSQRSEYIILDDFKYTRGMLCLVYSVPGVYSTWGIYPGCSLYPAIPQKKSIYHLYFKICTRPHVYLGYTQGE